jgi:hypothetical protein
VRQMTQNRSTLLYEKTITKRYALLIHYNISLHTRLPQELVPAHIFQNAAKEKP